MLKKIITPQNILIAVSAVFIAAAILLFLKYQTAQMELNKIKSDPQITQNLLTEVGKLIVLPTDETPTIATVTDVEKLRVNQPFFNSAKNGDKIIVYTKKAILYDPIAKKIIDVTVINPGTPSAQQAQSIKFFLINGTTKVGLTQKYEAALKKIVTNAVVVDRDNAKKNNYTKTILIDLNGTNQQLADQIAKALGITTDKLPEGETKASDADFLIIIGSDKENL